MARKMDTYSEEANIPPSVPSARVGIGSKSNMVKQGGRSPFVISRSKRGRRLSLPLRHEQEQEQARTGERGRDSVHLHRQDGGFPSLVLSSLGGLLAKERTHRRTPNFIITSRHHQKNLPSFSSYRGQGRFPFPHHHQVLMEQEGEGEAIPSPFIVSWL